LQCCVWYILVFVQYQVYCWFQNNWSLHNFCSVTYQGFWYPCCIRYVKCPVRIGICVITSVISSTALGFSSCFGKQAGKTIVNLVMSLSQIRSIRMNSFNENICNFLRWDISQRFVLHYGRVSEILGVVKNGKWKGNDNASDMYSCGISEIHEWALCPVWEVMFQQFPLNYTK
jgi:hypothetical protein